MVGWQVGRQQKNQHDYDRKRLLIEEQPLLLDEGMDMKKYDEKSALPVILQAAKDYEAKLKDRHFLIVYRKKTGLGICRVGFRDMHFLHLTGIKTKMSASMFFSACVENRLSIKDISMDATGKTQQKLAVLPYLAELLYHNCMIGNFINSGIAIKADYFIGDTKATISVGFRQNGFADIPVTLYHENIKNLSNPTCKVLAIFSKKYHIDRFDECTYLSKGYEIPLFPEIVKQQLCDQLYMP